jgi:nucleotide-binding universal stress UspA family protein
MSGVILAVVERPETTAGTLAAAGNLAALTGATRIDVLAIRTPPLATILPSEEVLTARDEARIRAKERMRVGAMEAAFDAWLPAAHERGIAAAWCEVEERADIAVGEWGRRADFLVLPRPFPHLREPEREAIHAALFDTDRPVLLVPPESALAPFGRRIALAWREDSRTTKALLAALRCLAQAERIEVLAGAREGVPTPHLPDILVEHGIEARLHMLPIVSGRTFGEALLAKAHAVGADLLVMGAYVHSPLRGLILGGVTRYMLAHADLPVLMRH